MTYCQLGLTSRAECSGGIEQYCRIQINLSVMHHGGHLTCLWPEASSSRGKIVRFGENPFANVQLQGTGFPI